MQWEKKICFRLTMRRIVGTILATSAVVNLVIVGAVYGADSAPTAPVVALTLSPPFSTAAISFTSTSTPGEIAALTPTSVIATVPADTFTPTQTATDVPLSMLCVKRFYWPIYQVKQGDWLSAIAAATGSSVRELMAANCLSNDRIYAGQLLHVPRVPANTVTPTYTSTNTPTPTDTSTITPTNTSSATPTGTPPPTATDTPTDSPSATPTYTNTPTPDTPTPTSTYTPTATPEYLLIAQP